MQKHILLTTSFLFVLTLLFFYPKPSDLLEKEYLIQTNPIPIWEQIKKKSNNDQVYSVYKQKEDDKKELDQDKYPMP